MRSSVAADAGRGEGADGSAAPCPVCAHVNPDAAKYCNECGSPVHLRECPHCEAINDRAASHCYKCAGLLPYFLEAGRQEGQPDVSFALAALQECPHCEAVNDPDAILCHRCEGPLAGLGADAEGATGSTPRVQDVPGAPRSMEATARASGAEVAAKQDAPLAGDLRARPPDEVDASCEQVAGFEVQTPKPRGGAAAVPHDGAVATRGVFSARSDGRIEPSDGPLASEGFGEPPIISSIEDVLQVAEPDAPHHYVGTNTALPGDAPSSESPRRLTPRAGPAARRIIAASVVAGLAAVAVWAAVARWLEHPTAFFDSVPALGAAQDRSRPAQPAVTPAQPVATLPAARVEPSALQDAALTMAPAASGTAAATGVKLPTAALSMHSRDPADAAARTASGEAAARVRSGRIVPMTAGAAAASATEAIAAPTVTSRTVAAPDEPASRMRSR